MFGSIAQTARDTDYVFTVDTTIEGTTESNQFKFVTTNAAGVLPTGSIFWEDVNDKSNNGFYNWDASIATNSPTITFPSEGTYKLRVPTNINWGRPQHSIVELDKNKIIEINNWGNHVMYGGLYQSFYLCNNLNVVCQDTPNFPSTHQLLRTFQSCISNTDPSGSLSNWDTSNCTNFSLFLYENHFFNTNISKWDTSKVTTLLNTFRLSWNFNQPIDTQEVTNYGRTYNAWDVSNVVDLGGTFGGSTTSAYSSSLFAQDLNNWDTSNVTNFSYIFLKCENFNNNITSWNVSSGTNFTGMFYYATIFNQPIENWDLGNAVNFYTLFAYARAFNQPIGNWDVSKVTTMYDTFIAANSFDQDISNWDVGQVTSFYRFNQSGILNQNLQSWDLSSCTLLKQMFYNNLVFNNGGQPLTSSYYNKHGREYLSWDTKLVTNYYLTFAAQSITNNTSSFNQDISNWDTIGATNFDYLFQQNTSFNQDISTKEVTVGAGTSLERTYNAWDVRNVTTFRRMFTSSPTSIFNQPIGNWQINTGSAVNMGLMFYNNDNFNQEISQSIVTVGSNTYKAWDVSEVTSMQQIFDGCAVFNKDISNWNIKNLINASYMFRSTLNFNQDLSKWDTRNVTTMTQMFYNSYFNNTGQSLTSSYYNPSDRDAYISWDTRNVSNFAYMFATSKSTPKFNSDISNWDTSAASSMALMFYSTGIGIFNQDISTKEVTVGAGTSLERTYNAWDVKNVVSFSQILQDQRSFNQPIGNWQLNTGSSANINMQYLLYNNQAFNQDISSSIVTVGSNTYLAWDTQRVSTFRRALRGTSIFNKPIGNWNTSNNSSLELTFAYAPNFNQNIQSTLQTHPVTGQDYIAWDVSKVTSFTQTFISADSFNKTIQNWNTVSGSTFSTMFLGSAFNKSLARQSVTINGKSWTSWDVSNSTSGSTTENHGATLTTMFENTSFDGEGLSTWNIESASFGGPSQGYRFGNNSNFTTYYDEILTEWAAQNPTYSGSIGFGTSTKYDGSVGSAPSASRSQLETVNGWIITDGGPV